MTDTSFQGQSDMISHTDTINLLIDLQNDIHVNKPNNDSFTDLLLLRIQMFLENITEEQIEQFREAFALFDKDGDGSINNKELKTVLKSLGHNPTKEEIDMFITLIDEDKSGTIDFREFLILISQRLNEKTLLDEVIEAFKIFDKDEDGYLARSELKVLLMRQGMINEDSIQDILDDIDNGEGLISCTHSVAQLLTVHINSN